MEKVFIESTKQNLLTPDRAKALVVWLNNQKDVGSDAMVKKFYTVLLKVFQSLGEDFSDMISIPIGDLPDQLSLPSGYRNRIGDYANWLNTFHIRDSLESINSYFKDNNIPLSIKPKDFERKEGDSYNDFPRQGTLLLEVKAT